MHVYFCVCVWCFIEKPAEITVCWSPITLYLCRWGRRVCRTLGHHTHSTLQTPTSLGESRYIGHSDKSLQHTHTHTRNKTLLINTTFFSTLWYCVFSLAACVFSINTIYIISCKLFVLHRRLIVLGRVDGVHSSGKLATGKPNHSRFKFPLFPTSMYSSLSLSRAG